MHNHRRYTHRKTHRVCACVRLRTGARVRIVRAARDLQAYARRHAVHAARSACPASRRRRLHVQAHTLRSTRSRSCGEGLELEYMYLMHSSRELLPALSSPISSRWNSRFSATTTPCTRRHAAQAQTSAPPPRRQQFPRCGILRMAPARLRAGTRTPVVAADGPGEPTHERVHPARSQSPCASRNLTLPIGKKKK